VCDENNSRIQVFAAGGAFRFAWGGLGSGPGAFRFPNDVAVDAAGNSYVADTDNHRVQKFAPDPSPAVPTTLGRVKAAFR
jgi:DNA-binding beta-propeller fold protein YncE